MQIHLIEAGNFHADGGAMFGAIPKRSWISRYPSSADNTCILTMRCMLIKDGDGRIILIDNGAGSKQPRLFSYYKFHNIIDLPQELRSLGIQPEDITDIILTHLHFDHCGGTTIIDDQSGALRPAFPNAIHWISRAQWDICFHPNPLEKDSFRAENVEILNSKVSLRLIQEDVELSPTIRLRLFGGHTPGQIVTYIKAPDQTHVFVGDLIPLSAHVSPEWISAYDMFPQESYTEKIRLLEEAATEKQRLIYCHDAYCPSSMIKKIRPGQYKPI